MGIFSRLLGHIAIGASRCSQGLTRPSTLGLLSGLALLGLTSGARADDAHVFVIGNFPVEARAADAVKAKERAIADGQQAAFRSLLKRIVPVTSYGRLKPVTASAAGPMIEGLSVRSERNSATEYIASYDFAFQPDAVRRLLDNHGIPYVDKQAPRIVVVPVSRTANSQAASNATWTAAWRSLDLGNTLTPVTIAEPKRAPAADGLKAALAGDLTAQRALAGDISTSLIVIALLEPSADGKKATVTLSGQDAVGPLMLERSYRLDGDIAYTSELAAVVALGVLEGRWKAANAHLTAAPQPSMSGGFAPPAVPGYGEGARTYGAHGGPVAGSLIRLSVAFQGMGEWQNISRRLAATPGVDNLEVEGLSARSARIALSFPGGAQELARALSSQGLSLRNGPDGLVLSDR